ncbi:MAG: SPOR domain-containing protein [Micrococcales bacterium]
MSQPNPVDTPEPDAKWWYNMRTGVTEFGLKSNAIDRVGPFDTKEQAEKAPEILRERSKAWSEQEANEN